MNPLRLMIVLLLQAWSVSAIAQDPFFTHFYNNESVFNPALVGYRGATSFSLKYKRQWSGRTTQPFESGTFSFEESMPCTMLDYGLGFGWDREGSGLLTTYDFGGRVAGTFALESGDALHNFRIGGNIQFTYKTIDFSRLIFSDELDPKYGTVDADGHDLPTGFTPPPDGNRSDMIFTPAVGLVYQFLSDQRSKKPFSLLAGFTYHNVYSIGSNRYGNIESLLGIGTRLPERMSFFLMPEFIPYNNNWTYVAITPLVAYQKQGALNYWETGAKVAMNRLLSMGAYYHFNGKATPGNHTNWFTFMVEFGSVMTESTRIDLGLAYSNNFTGLRNVVGPILEFSLAFHLQGSGMCRLMGLADDGTRNTGPLCPKWAFSPKRKKLYENIWYKTNR